MGINTPSGQIAIYGTVGKTAVTVALLGLNGPLGFFSIQNVDSANNIAYTFDGTAPALSVNGSVAGIGNFLAANGGVEYSDVAVPRIKKLQLVAGGSNTSYCIRYAI